MNAPCAVVLLVAVEDGETTVAVRVSRECSLAISGIVGVLDTLVGVPFTGGVVGIAGVQANGERSKKRINTRRIKNLFCAHCMFWVLFALCV